MGCNGMQWVNGIAFRFNGVLMEGCLRDLNGISIGFSPPISVVLFAFSIKKF